MGQKLGIGLCPLFREGKVGLYLTQRRLGRGLPQYQVASWCIHPWGHNKNGPKIGEGAPPPFGKGARSTSNKVTWAEAYLHAKCHLDPSSRLATINMGQKFGKGAPPPFWGGRTGSPSNTKSPGLRPTSTPSGIWMHQAIWPQQKWAEKKNLGGGGSAPFWRGGAGPHLTQSRLGWGLPPYQVAS